jgi:hypothetical protein
MQLLEFRRFIPLFAVVMLSACGSGDDKVSYQSGGLTHTFVSAKEASKQTFLLPLYPNAKTTGEVQAQGQEEQNSFMILSTSDPVDKVTEYYLTELKKSGWIVSQQQVLPALVNLNARKDKLEGSIMLSADEHKQTTINLSVAVEPEGTPELSKEQVIPDKTNPPTD